LSTPTVYSSYFFHDTASTDIYTLSLHDALPICVGCRSVDDDRKRAGAADVARRIARGGADRRVAVGGHFARREVDAPGARAVGRSEEHTSELQSRENLVCRLLLEKKKKNTQ